jgi:hypothetical protein
MSSEYLTVAPRAFSLTFPSLSAIQTPSSSHKRCTGDEWVRPAEAAVYQPESGSLGRPGHINGVPRRAGPSLRERPGPR